DRRRLQGIAAVFAQIAPALGTEATTPVDVDVVYRSVQAGRRPPRVGPVQTKGWRGLHRRAAQKGAFPAAARRRGHDEGRLGPRHTILWADSARTPAVRARAPSIQCARRSGS